MAKKTTASRSGRKGSVPKSLRRHRPCPHCGATQPGAKTAPHRPHRPRRRSESGAVVSASAVVAAAPSQSAEGVPEQGHPAETPVAELPEPIDAMTVIKGVVERLPAVLAEIADYGEPPPQSALNAVVRKSVLDEFRTRAQFAGRLAEIDSMLWLRRADGDDAMDAALDQHLRDLRLLRLTEPETGDRFVVTEGEGESFELLRPAYVDELTGKVILAGQLKRVPSGEITDAGKAR